jgi:uncharacterized membrane protein
MVWPAALDSMNSLVLALASACCTAVSCLFFRKNADTSVSSSSPNGYLLFYYLSAVLLSTVAYPRMWSVGINIPLVLLGATVGVLNCVLMVFIFRALKQGPVSLTIAFQNSSTVFPGFILFALLGPELGFSYSYTQLIGMVLVVVGLFSGIKMSSIDRNPASQKWFRYVVGAFFLQILTFCCVQLRCQFFETGKTEVFDLALTHADDAWYLTGQFSASFLTQYIIFFLNKQRVHTPSMYYGLWSGLCNFTATWLILLATKYALPLEKGVVFPCFSVATMVLCNIWAMRLYKEPFIVRTHLLCSLGIFVASPG